MRLMLALNARLATIEYWLIALFISILVLISVVQVVLRYFFASPLFWAEEISVLMLIFTTFFGIGYLLYHNKMLSVDIFNTKIHGNLRKVLLALTHMIGISTLALMSYYLTLWILDPVARVEVSATTTLPKWYNYTVVCFSFYIMTFHELVNLLMLFQGGNTQEVIS